MDIALKDKSLSIHVVIIIDVHLNSAFTTTIVQLHLRSVHSMLILINLEKSKVVNKHYAFIIKYDLSHLRGCQYFVTDSTH